MADKPVIIRTPRAPMPAARILLLVLVPLALLFNYYANRVALSRDIKSIVFVQPLGWSYHSETAVVPNLRRVEFSAQGLADAMREGHAVPLFLLSRYPAQDTRPNPIIGVNVYELGDSVAPRPEALLAIHLEQAQKNAGNALSVVEPIAPLPIATLPGARVVLSAKGSPLDRMTVYTLIAGHLSFTVIGSDASRGDEAMDGTLAEFLANIGVE